MIPASSISRRRFLQGSAAGLAVLPQLGTAASPSASAGVRGTFSLDDTRVRFQTPAAVKSSKILFVADTHLFRDDERGTPYHEFSGRMAKAYNETRHFRSQKATTPETCFAETLQAARDEKTDLIVLGGDILSFPSEAGVEWVSSQMKDTGIPWMYTAGNHDWHYEGMEGTSASLRSTWSRKRLAPFYQGKGPLMDARDVNGTRIVTLDNSTYEVEPEQLDFFRQQVASGQPLILCVHIPLYAPGRPVGFGCGHPAWGAASDKSHLIERRPRWRESGHTQTTLDFHREVFSAANLLGIFAGHTHKASLDVQNGIPQFVTAANATGAHLLVEVTPAAS